MPKFVSWLLSLLANPAYRSELIGDMEEEYTERRHTHQETKRWLLRQLVWAIWDGQKAMVRSTNFVKAVSVVLLLVIMPTIVLFVGWLSNMEQPTESLWQLLIAGNIHSLLLSSEYWILAWNESGVTHLTLGMFINIPSILWSAVFAGATYYLLKQSNVSVWVFSLFTLIFMLLPYLFGHTVIAMLEPAVHKVGPILAFMILAPFFTLPTFVYFLFKRYPK